jgi:hypothetical protein
MHKYLDKDPVGYLQKTKIHDVDTEIMKVVSDMTHIDARKRP